MSVYQPACAKSHQCDCQWWSSRDLPNPVTSNSEGIGPGLVFGFKKPFLSGKTTGTEKNTAAATPGSREQAAWSYWLCWCSFVWPSRTQDHVSFELYRNRAESHFLFAKRRTWCFIFRTAASNGAWQVQEASHLSRPRWCSCPQLLPHSSPAPHHLNDSHWRSTVSFPINPLPLPATFHQPQW